MNKKDLKKFIKEEIFSILSEDMAADKAAQDAKKVAIDKEITALQKKKAELSKGPQSALAEEEIAELARLATVIKIGNPEAVNAARAKYKGNWKSELLDKVEQAGDAGITQVDLARELGKVDEFGDPVQQLINPIVRELIASGAITKGEAPVAKYTLPKEPKIKKEKPAPIVEPTPVEEPKATSGDEEEGEEEIDDDEYYKYDPEDQEVEKEPSPEDIKKAEKSTDGAGYAKKLTPEEEEKLDKIRKGINTKLERILKLPKAKRTTSDDYKVLQQLVKRDDVKKLFKAKGINVRDLISGV